MSAMVARWPRLRLSLAAGLAAVWLLSLPAAAQRAPSDYRESDAVLVHYPSVSGVSLASPAFADGASSLTSQDRLMAFVSQLSAASPHVRLASMGRSQQGRELPLLYVTQEGLDDPAAIARLGRPVIWLIGQQHGNEPAGGEAMLAVAAALSSGELQSLLERISVVIVPRGNPDGAAADRRVLASGADPNRDHLLLSQPEVRALHQAMQHLPPDVVIDHHEFSVAWRWLEKFGALQASDVMILEATHPGVPRGLTDVALTLYRPRIEAAMTARGLTSHDYVTTAAKMDDRLVSLGGNAPGIARNTFGLRGSVSYLIETRGVGIALQSYQRRVATHYLLAKAVLEAAAEQGPALRTAIAAARQAAANDGSPLVVSHKVAQRPADLPLIDPQSGAISSRSITLADSRKPTAIEQRSRPRGYLVLRGAAAVAERLALNEVTSCIATARSQVAVEAYDMQRVAPGSNAGRESINPDQSVKVTVRPAIVDVPAGALFVPMNQAAAGIAAAALEPDSPGSYVGVGVVPLSDSETEAPVYRVTSDNVGCGAR
ncbi:MAG: M14 family metallocarboxypeptidase [Alphaproteobacteria bacterium]|nr:M14 family metallocarboxypeptidase [Alphaproteobacteria bacterium]